MAPGWGGGVTAPKRRWPLIRLVLPPSDRGLMEAAICAAEDEGMDVSLLCDRAMPLASDSFFSQLVEGKGLLLAEPEQTLLVVVLEAARLREEARDPPRPVFDPRTHSPEILADLDSGEMMADAYRRLVTMVELEIERRER